jgi:membrane protein DedA with SNARE-associated domain
MIAAAGSHQAKHCLTARTFLPIFGHVMLGTSIAALLTWAGHHPLTQAAAIILGTFILEDAATVLAAMQVGDGSLSGPLALASLYVGIALGDLGLYGLGWLAARLPPIARLLPPRRNEVIRAWIDGRIFRVVLVSRFLPGLRLPAYTTCGFVRADLRQFALAVVIATICWTSMLFGVSLRIGEVLMDHFGAWRWAGGAGFVVFIIVAGRLAAFSLQSRRQ